MNKKRTFVYFIIILLLVGCANINNTPTGKVESFLERYQKLDKDVLKELDLVLEKEDNMSSEEKEEYKKILIRQYQNLAYKIKSEDIDKDLGVVEVSIEVLNYKDAIKNSKDYYLEHEDLFKNSMDTQEYIDYKLKQLRSVNNKVKYDLTFQLSKKDGIWVINDFNDIDREKIHGLY